MPIKEIEHLEIDVDLPTITADQPLDPSKTQILPPLPNKSCLICAIGRPGSGKTSKLFSYIGSKKRMYWRVFHKIHLIVPPASLSSVKMTPIRKHDRTYDHLDYEVLDSILDQTMTLTEDFTRKDKFTLVMIDDFASALKDKELQKSMETMCFNHRHMGISLFYAVQSWRKIPNSLRKQFPYLFLWSVSDLEMSVVWDEIITWMDKKTFYEYCKYCWNADKFGTHACMFIAVNEQKIYSNRANDFFLLTHE